jgi:hypothetical protein
MEGYKAHWSILLIVLSALLSALCVALALQAFRNGSWWLGLSLLGLVIGCALFAIRGYTITPDAILVHRLFWATRLPLAGLQSAQPVPIPVLPGIRIGNGGFFSFSGWRYSPGLGFYRVLVTDHRRAVVLHYPERTVVVSPSAPQDFVHDLPVPGPSA